MSSNNKTLSAICITGILFAIVLLYSCNKSKDTTRNPTQPPPNTPSFSITSITPAKATYGTDVSVSGNGFSRDPNNNTVTINGYQAAVKSATSSELVITIPKGCGSGAISLTIGGRSVQGPGFTYILKASVSTFAGSGVPGFADGIGEAAQFLNPSGIAFSVDGQSSIYVADAGNFRIRKITSDGVVTTLAGSGIQGTADGMGSAAQFSALSQIIADANYIYVTDGSRIRKISMTGEVATLAGSLTSGYADGTGSAAQFRTPAGITTDFDGNIYVADYADNRIRKITSDGVVTTLAGDGVAGSTDGSGTAARFNGPLGIKLNSYKELYVADVLNNSLRKISTSGVVTTPMTFPAGFEVSSLTSAGPSEFYGTQTIGSQRIVHIPSSFQSINNFAGTGIAGFSNGSDVQAQFNNPTSIIAHIDFYNDAQDVTIFVSDALNNRIRKIVGE